MPSVTVHREPLTDFLERQYNAGQGTAPTANPPGICLMSGQIVRRNLRRRLAELDIPATSLAEYVTLEELSHRVLETARDESVIELDSDFRQRLLETVLANAEAGEHSDQLETFATRVAWHETETLEQIDSELSDYLRCTDSTADHEKLVDVARSAENHYIETEMPTRLGVFRELSRHLTDAIGDEDLELLLTRSHAVTAAKEATAANWTEAFGNRSWLAVSTLNVLDNTTLRFLLEIGDSPEGPDVHFFFGTGTYERQVTRLEECEQVSDVRTPDEDSAPREYMAGTAASTLISAAHGEEFTSPETLEFVEAPERRREVEHVVQSIREDLAEGVDPSEILVLARDVGVYQSIIEDVFETNEIPFHVETPRPHAHLPAYRFFKALLDLITKANDADALTYEDLTDPLRLGFCPPGRRSSAWPLDDQVFLYLEQRLHSHQQRNDDEPLTFEEWRTAIGDMDGWEFAWDLLGEYLDWVAEQIDEPPQQGSELREFMRSLLRSYVYHRIPDRRGVSGGPGVEPTRTNLTQDHPSSTGRQILSQADAVGRHYDFARSILDEPATWEQITRAVGEVVGSGRYGAPNNDGNAIQIVDIGNAYYHTADQAYFLGVAVGELPIGMEPQPFIHTGFRNEVARQAKQGVAPMLHFDSRASQYEVDLDLYEAALRASTGKITLLHRYKDSERNQIEWSPFVDLLPTEEQRTRIRADQWLPEPTDGEAWGDTARHVSPKDRIRLLYHHAARQHPSRRPEIAAEDIGNIATYANADAVASAVMPRYDRYARPPTELDVSTDEPAFETGLALPEIIGGPVRPQELDLLGHCELKYHFYQLLFNHTGDSIQRDAIPFYTSARPHYRFGSLPQVIRHHHPEDDYLQQWAEIITEHFPDRQADLGAVDSIEALREWFAEREFSDWHERVLLPVLEDEWELVQQELDAGIERDWEWREPQNIEIDIDGDTHALRQPAHRRDQFPDDDNYALPVFFVRNTSYAAKAAKRCWQYAGTNMDRHCHTICRTCGNYDDCSYTTKHVLDHRIHSVALEGADVVGVQYQERFDSDARRGYLKENHAEAVRGGIEGGPEAAFGEDTFDGWQWHQYWTPQLTDDIETKLQPLALDEETTEVTFSVDEQFVEADGCDSCVYRDMCMVPHAYGGDQ